MILNKTFTLALVGMVGLSITAQARDQIKIVGSSTVYPFSTVVAERFGKTGAFKTPIVESTGSGGGLKLFCAGAGDDTPDIANASRRIKESEVETCAKNGVTEIVEVKIGYDGIVIANSKEAGQIDLTRRELYMALAKDLPTDDGKITPNPNMTWKDINSALPDTKIQVYGPPPTSGTRDAFVELVMDEGCETFAGVEKMEKAMAKTVCRTIREDGAYVEAGENDNLIVRKLNANKDAFGIFGFSFLDQNSDSIQGSKVGGTDPTFDNIADGAYPVSRPLFFYVKKAHIGQVPGIEEYINEFVSDKATGEDGYLSEKGLIPLGGDERKKVVNDATSLSNLSM